MGERFLVSAVYRNAPPPLALPNRASARGPCPPPQAVRRGAGGARAGRGRGSRKDDACAGGYRGFGGVGKGLSALRYMGYPIQSKQRNSLGA